MKRLDIHVHCDSNDPEKLDIIAAECRRLQTIIAFSGGPGYGGFDYVPNEEVVEICKRYPDCFLPLAKLTLWDTASADEVYKYAEMGVRGFKCIYPYYEYDHDIYMPLYEAAEKCGLPILFHTGNYRPHPADVVYRRPVLKNMNPVNLDRIARSFPKLNLVMAHMGTRIYHDEASQYIKMHENLYADFAGSGQWMRIQPEQLARDLSFDIGIIDDRTMNNFRKIVLGSDAYVTHPHIIAEAQTYYEMLFARIGVREDIVREIMGGTVAKWMNVKLDD